VLKFRIVVGSKFKVFFTNVKSSVHAIHAWGKWKAVPFLMLDLFYTWELFT